MARLVVLDRQPAVWQWKNHCRHGRSSSSTTIRATAKAAHPASAI